MDANRIVGGDCVEVMRELPDGSADCVVTDPPYGYSFMGKDWDKAVPSVDVWRECLRVLKAGAFMFVMSSPRQDVLSQMIVRVGEAGFRTDFTSIYWCYASGFPKAANISKMVDKRNGRQPEQYKELGKYLRKARGNRPQKEIAQFFLSKTGSLTGCVANWELGLNVPTKEQWVILKRELQLDSRFDDLIEREEAERQVIGRDKNRGQVGIYGIGGAEWNITSSATDEAKLLDGSYGGFQPKPALECILACQKPLDKQAELTIITSQALQLIEVIVECLDVSNAETNIPEDMVGTVQGLVTAKTIEEAKAQLGKVGKLWLADTLPFILERMMKDIALTNWNIGSLWKSILVDLLAEMSKFTIETVTELITELKTLNSLILSTMRENITLQAKTPQNGLKFNVSIVEIILKSVLTKLLSQKQTSATENATSNICSQGELISANNVEKNLEPTTQKENSVLSNATGKVETKVIIVAMKPLSEKTFVSQALANGKGVTWLDKCRIPANPEIDDMLRTTKRKVRETETWENGSGFKNENNKVTGVREEGRFPANLLVSDNCLDTGKKSESHGHFSYKWRQSPYEGGWRARPEDAYYSSDFGDFSRFFSLDAWAKLPAEVRRTFPFLIVPKASKSERNKGLKNTLTTGHVVQLTNEGGAWFCLDCHRKYQHTFDKCPKCGSINRKLYHVGSRQVKNFHPTVKPLNLMRYLITMGTRAGDLVLDPFVGSGTTCVAAKMLGRKYIGIDNNPEYIPIAEARLNSFQTLTEFIDPEISVSAENTEEKKII